MIKKYDTQTWDYTQVENYRRFLNPDKTQNAWMWERNIVLDTAIWWLNM